MVITQERDGLSTLEGWLLLHNVMRTLESNHHQKAYKGQGL